MALMAILICLAIQRFFHFDSYSKHYNWFEFYFKWFEKRYCHFAWWLGWGAIVVIVIAPVIVFAIFAAVLSYLLTPIAYFLLTVLVLWYAMDSRRLNDISHKNTDIKVLLLNTYQKLFALIFWVALAGPTGVVFYMLVTHIHYYLRHTRNEEALQPLLRVIGKLHGVIDWLPQRLLSLTYALAGHFSLAFKFWSQNFLLGLALQQKQVVEGAFVALGLSPVDKAEKNHIDIAAALIDRGLLIWLVVLALITIARWIG